MITLNHILIATNLDLLLIVTAMKINMCQILLVRRLQIRNSRTEIVDTVLSEVVAVAVQMDTFKLFSVLYSRIVSLATL